MEDICKFHQTGFCKHGSQCNRKHMDEVCPEFRECSERNCVRRHPKSCKYFARNQYCKFEKCAYSHDKTKSQHEIESLEKEVTE